MVKKQAFYHTTTLAPIILKALNGFIWLQSHMWDWNHEIIGILNERLVVAFERKTVNIVDMLGQCFTKL